MNEIIRESSVVLYTRVCLKCRKLYRDQSGNLILICPSCRKKIRTEVAERLPRLFKGEEEDERFC